MKAKTMSKYSRKQMSRTYHKVRIANQDGTKKTLWAENLKRLGKVFWTFTEVKKDGSKLNVNRIYLCDDETLIWKKPATMNMTFCELELEE
jgi:hypothetical protein